MRAWLRFQLGDQDADTLRELREAGTRYLANADGLPLHTVLGAGTPRQARYALRDELLRRAADLHDAPTAWRRAVAMHKSAQDFTRYRWPRWSKRGAPSRRATPLEVLLFRARCYGTFPDSEEGFLALLS